MASVAVIFSVDSTGPHILVVNFFCPYADALFYAKSLLEMGIASL
jgi:hypothetical protein